MDMPHPTVSLLGALPRALTQETIDILLAAKGVRLERIVSQGHSSPADFWYNQAEAEWVILLTGNAILEFEEENAPRHLTAGDCVFLPAHCRHRVAWTNPDQPTVWLALFLDPAMSPVCHPTLTRSESKDLSND